jgi:hypothetical protein
MNGEPFFTALQAIQGVIHGGLQFFITDIAVKVEPERRRAARQRPAGLQRRQDMDGCMLQSVIAACAEDERIFK